MAKISIKNKLFCYLITIVFCLQNVVFASNENNKYSTDVIIVGGGLSGLITAYKLKKAGLSCKVLEISPRVGGRARTAKYQDTIVETGLAEFWESNPIIDLIKELKLPYKTSLTYSSVMINKKIYPFIQDTNEDFLKTVLNNQEIIAFRTWNNTMERYYKQIKLRNIDNNLRSLEQISFSDWVKKYKLSKKTQEWIRVLIEVEIGTSWDRISALDGIAEWHIFLGKGESPYELENGNDSLPDALAKKIGNDNIILNTQVIKFNDNKNGVEIDAVNINDTSHVKFKAKYAVSAIPLYRLSELQFNPPLSKERQNAISSQNWGSYFTAHVFIDKKAEKYWTNSKGDNYLPILSDSPLGVIYSATESKTNNSCIINLLITGDYAEKFNHRAILFENVRNELNNEFEKLWKGSSKYIKDYKFYRYHPRAIASWPVGRSRFDKLSELMRKPQGNIYFAGDFTESSHSDGAINSATRVVKEILARENLK